MSSRVDFSHSVRLFAAGFALIISFGVQAVENIACIGNSITEANKQVFASVGVYINKGGYPAHLDTLMGDGYTTKNYGKGGRHVARAEQGGSSYWNTTSYPIVRQANHSIYVMMFGTNDSKDEVWSQYGADFAKDYAALAESLTVNNPDAVMFLCRPLPIWENDYDCRGDVLVDSIIPIIDSIADADGYPLIDLYTPMLEMQDHIPDGVHPDSVAAKRIAELVRDAILENVGTKRQVYEMRARNLPNGYEAYVPIFSTRERLSPQSVNPVYMLNGKTAGISAGAEARSVITIRPREENR